VADSSFREIPLLVGSESLKLGSHAHLDGGCSPPVVVSRSQVPALISASLLVGPVSPCPTRGQPQLFRQVEEELFSAYQDWYLMQTESVLIP